MKKFFSLCFLIVFSVALYAAPKDLQVSTYFTNKNPIGNLSDYSSSYLGIGTGFDYTIPKFEFLSLIGRVDAETVLCKNPKHNNWWGFTFTGGLQCNFEIKEYFVLSPSISYGVMFNTLSIEGESKYFADQVMQTAIALKFYPDFLKERLMGFEITPLYTLAFEQDLLIHYLGVRAGFSYYFN